jgi:amicoumacin kinase
MEAEIIKRFSDGILQEVMSRYAISDGEIRILDGFESFIYEFGRPPEAYILRISHSLRRSESLIQGEVDWINYLAGGGVSVARAVLSKNENLVEAVEDGQGGFFLATAFVKAQGRPPWDAWTPALYRSFGKLLGSMHSLTKRYKPARPEWKRPEWDDEVMEFVERYLPASETLAKAKYQACLDHLRALPKDPSSYGLIHQDANGTNLLVDETGRITLFDFDDCVYSWFVNDIAIVLFYIVTSADDRTKLTGEFMSHFLQGYRQANRLDPAWLKEMPVFLKMREIELYAVIHRDFDVNQIDDEWCERFMRNRKHLIEEGIPYIDFDFELLSSYL